MNPDVLRRLADGGSSESYPDNSGFNSNPASVDPEGAGDGEDMTKNDRYTQFNNDPKLTLERLMELYPNLKKRVDEVRKTMQRVNR